MLKIMDVYAQAMKACVEGRYGAAVQDFKWLHDHENDDSLEYRIMRRGYVLASWIALGKFSYPPALDALKEILHAKQLRIDAGEVDSELLLDVEAIKNQLSRLDY